MKTPHSITLPKTQSTQHILLADDDSDDCDFFKEALDGLQEHTRLTTVNNGERLMELLNTNEQLPDIIFLDINMPRKNGFECLSEIKLSKRLKEIPVIMFTTTYEQGVVNRLYENGAQHFICKPAVFSQFKKIIQHSLTLVAIGVIAQPIKEKFMLTVENCMVN